MPELLLEPARASQGTGDLAHRDCSQRSLGIAAPQIFGDACGRLAAYQHTAELDKDVDVAAGSRTWYRRQRPATATSPPSPPRAGADPPEQGSQTGCLVAGATRKRSRVTTWPGFALLLSC